MGCAVSGDGSREFAGALRTRAHAHEKTRRRDRAGGSGGGELRREGTYLATPMLWSAVDRNPPALLTEFVAMTVEFLSLPLPCAPPICWCAVDRKPPAVFRAPLAIT